jgi:hypothetical protein
MGYPIMACHLRRRLLARRLTAPNHPMLPVVRGDDGDALMVAFYEPGMIFESRNILPAVEPKPFACVLS